MDDFISDILILEQDRLQQVSRLRCRPVQFLWKFQEKYRDNCMDGEFHPCPNPISSAEPSDNSASHSSVNGYKATPVN